MPCWKETLAGLKRDRASLMDQSGMLLHQGWVQPRWEIHLELWDGGQVPGDWDGEILFTHEKVKEGVRARKGRKGHPGPRVSIKAVKARMLMDCIVEC